MARVPVHFRDKLTSEKTGVNSLDTSLATQARAISQMADNFQQVANVELQKGRELEKKTALHAATADFGVAYMQKAAEIKSQYASNPEEGALKLNEAADEISEGILAGTTGRHREEMASMFGISKSKLRVEHKGWEIKATATNIKRNITRAAQTTIQGLTLPEATQDNLVESLIQWNEDVDGVQDDNSIANQILGNEGDTALSQKELTLYSDSMTKAYILGQVGQGNVFEALKVMARPEVKKYTSLGVWNELKREVTAAFTGKETKADVQAGFAALQGNLELLEGIDLGDSPANLEEKLNETLFSMSNLKQRRALIPADQTEALAAHDNQVRKMELQARAIKAAKKSNLSQRRYLNEDDPLIVNQFVRAVANVMKFDNDTNKENFRGTQAEAENVKGLSAKLDKVLEVSVGLMERFGDEGGISDSTLRDLAFVMEKGFETKQGREARDVLNTKPFLDPSIREQAFSPKFAAELKPLNDIFDEKGFKTMVQNLDDQWVFDYSKEYIRQLRQIDPALLDLEGEAKDAALFNAKKRAFAKAANIPVTEVGSSVWINNVAYPVVDFDKMTGMPLFEPGDVR